MSLSFDSAGVVAWIMAKIGLKRRLLVFDKTMEPRPGDFVFRNLSLSILPPSFPGTWWTCGVCGRRSAWTPGTLIGWGDRLEVYKPSFWYEMDGVLHCKDCGWKQTDKFKMTGEPPADGWYPPCDGKPVLEYSRMDVHERRYVIVEETP